MPQPDPTLTGPPLPIAISNNSISLIPFHGISISFSIILFTNFISRNSIFCLSYSRKQKNMWLISCLLLLPTLIQNHLSSFTTYGSHRCPCPSPPQVTQFYKFSQYDLSDHIENKKIILSYT